MTGLVAWVTGASSGLGAATAERLAGDGWIVAASARSADALARLDPGPGRIVPVPLDITDADAAASAVARIETEVGPIGQAVLNAGIYDADGIADFDAGRFARTVGTNLVGTANCLAPLLPRMLARGGGRIALVASVAGYRGLPRALSYGPTKAALINLAEALAIEGRRHGIVVQVVNPGFVATPATAGNDFPMPFLMSAERAAASLVRGLGTDRFEIAFPWQFVLALRLAALLPWRLYQPLIRWRTGA